MFIYNIYEYFLIHLPFLHSSLCIEFLHSTGIKFYGFHRIILFRTKYPGWRSSSYFIFFFHFYRYFALHFIATALCFTVNISKRKKIFWIFHTRRKWNNTREKYRTLLYRIFIISTSLRFVENESEIRMWIYSYWI